MTHSKYWSLKQALWLKRRIPAGEHDIGSRSVFILPTAQGLYLALFLVAMLLACINYNLSLGYLLTFFVFAVALGAMLRTHQTLLSLVCSAPILNYGATQEPSLTCLFVGDEASFEIQLSNPSKLAKYGIALAWKVQTEPPQESTVLPNGQTKVQLGLPCTERGRFEVPSIVVSTRYPLGLWRAWSYVRAEPTQTHYWVVPQPQSPLPLMIAQSLAPVGTRTTQLATLNQQGDALSHLQTVEQVSAKRLHWPSLAKGVLAQKILDCDDLPALKVRLDLTNCTLAGIEAQLSQLCAGVLHCHAQKTVFSLHLGQQTIPADGIPTEGQTHVLACLEALAAYPVDA